MSGSTLSDTSSSTAGASFDSLLIWLNTFDLGDQTCTRAEDLCSGRVIQSCLASVHPEVGGDDKDPWTEIIAKLEHYCVCSLEKSVCLQKVKDGNLEEMAKVIVLLICYFVEDESINQNVIEQIMQLSLGVQRDLMSLIELGLGKVNSETLSSGNFHSGVDCGADTSSLQTDGCLTPVRQSRHRSSSVFHRGLDSPAGRRWLSSPALSAHKRRVPRTPLIASIVTTSLRTDPMTDSSAEDLLILRHQLSVLEKKFESEKQLSVDLNTELQSMNQTCSSLQDTNNKLTVKLTSVESQLKDVLDELLYKERKLEETQVILTKNRLEIDALSGLKETVGNLEAKLDDFEVVKCELQHQTKKLHDRDLVLVEREAELRRLKLVHENTLAELDDAVTKKESSLIEASREYEELWGQFKQLERDKSRVESLLLQKSSEVDTSTREFDQYKMEANERVVILEESNVNLGTKLEAAHEVNTLWKQQIETLEKSNTDLQAKLVIAKKEHELYNTGMDQQVQTLEKLNDDIQAEIIELSKENECYQQQMDEQLQSLQATNSELENRLGATLRDHDLYKEQAREKYQVYKQEMDEQLETLKKVDVDLQANLDQTCHDREMYKQQVTGQMNTLQKTNTDLQADLKAAHEEIELIRPQMETAEKSTVALKTALDTAQREHESYKTETKEQIQALEKANGDLEAKMATMCEEHDTYKLKIDETQQALVNLQEQLNSSYQVHELYQQQATSQMNTLKTINSRLEAETKAIMKEKATLEGVNAELQAKLDMSCEEYKASRLEVQALDTTNATLQSRFDKACQEHESYKTDMSDKFQTSEEQHTKLQHELNTTRQEHALFKQEVTSKVESLQKANTRLEDDLMAPNQEHELYKTEITNRLNTVEKANLDLRVELNAISEECEQYKTNVLALQANNCDIKTKFDEVCKHHESSQQEVQNLKENVSALECRLETAREDEIEANARVQILKGANSQLRNDMMFVQRELKEQHKSDDSRRSSTTTLTYTTSAPSELTATSSHKNTASEGNENRVGELQRRNLMTHPHLKSSYPIEMQVRPEGNENRVGELQRRNLMTHPHLKSSYPIEMQVRPECPSVSNDIIKNGHTAFISSFDEPSTSRKRSRDVDSSVSIPPSSHARISAPPSPTGSATSSTTTKSTSFSTFSMRSTHTTESTSVKTRSIRPTLAELKKNAQGSMKLRDYLDERTSRPPISGTSFDVPLSPPKRAMPKRLQSRVTKSKTSPPEERRQTVVKPKQPKSKK